MSYFSSKYKANDRLSENGVYIIPCKNCNKIYVGETERSLQLRVTEHRKYAKDPKKSAVARHQLECGHVMDFDKAAIKIHENNLLKRKILEYLMIKNNQVLENNSSSYTPSLFI